MDRGNIINRKGEIMTWRNAIKLKKIRSRTMKMINLGIKTIMIYKEGDDFHATEGLCRHMRWPLSWGGKIEDGCVTCPLHQTSHRLEDGELIDWAPFPMFPPYGKLVGKLSKRKNLKIYKTRKQGDYLQIYFD